MTCKPELAQLDAGARQLGIGLDHTDDVAGGGIGVHAQQQVGRGEIEEAEGMRLHELRAVHDLAQQLARSCGMRTAMIASQALDDAS